MTDRYCPACRGHGTDVHECEELKSVVVPRYIVVHILSCYWADPEIEADVATMCDLARLVGFDLPPEFARGDGEKREGN